MLKKKIWANFQRITGLFTQKIVTKLSKIWVWDPRLGIRKNLFRIRDPGSRGQKGIRTRIRIRNTGSYDSYDYCTECTAIVWLAAEITFSLILYQCILKARFNHLQHITLTLFIIGQYL